MSIYHLHAKVISRGKGQSVCAAASYRSGDKIQDERYDTLHDYGKKQGVEYTEIIALENAPDWVRDRPALWNKVKAGENRKDAQEADQQYDSIVEWIVEIDSALDGVVDTLINL